MHVSLDIDRQEENQIAHELSVWSDNGMHRAYISNSKLHLATLLGKGEEEYLRWAANEPAGLKKLSVDDAGVVTAILKEHVTYHSGLGNDLFHEQRENIENEKVSLEFDVKSPSGMCRAYIYNGRLHFARVLNDSEEEYMKWKAPAGTEKLSVDDDGVVTAALAERIEYRSGKWKKLRSPK